TVVTTTFNIATLLKCNSNISVILIGGLLRGPGESMVGELAEAMLDRLHVPKAFIGAAGVTAENGIMYANPLEAQIRRKIVQRSRTVVLVADHSKFGRPALVSVCPLTQVHHVITGHGILPEFYTLMVSNGIKVTMVGHDSPSSLEDQP
ncbi:MAG: DeoR family transcriptional regulator, partial [Firmicutes bacterium]|nr:DeoR family transcriptional regulator [Bacillota bacterium]